VGFTTAALYGADTRPDAAGLSLSENQIAALGAVEPLQEEALCTGIIVAPSSVLTARHCDNLGGLWFVASRGAETTRVRVVTRVPHPDRDVSSLRLESSVELLGILSEGSATCTGTDAYDRADTLGDWVTTTIAAVTQAPCAGLTWEGTCSAGVPTWCDAGEVKGDACRSGESCGYDPGARGFRCRGTRSAPPVWS